MTQSKFLRTPHLPIQPGYLVCSSHVSHAFVWEVCPWCFPIINHEASESDEVNIEMTTLFELLVKLGMSECPVKFVFCFWVEDTSTSAFAFAAIALATSFACRAIC